MKLVLKDQFSDWLFVSAHELNVQMKYGSRFRWRVVRFRCFVSLNLLGLTQIINFPRARISSNVFGESVQCMNEPLF